ncbi:MAG: ECF transporter S component [Peptostreptococcaceae bacterium]|nr:ECF transporter S component [Peptostreptococcaceae bacterium]
MVPFFASFERKSSQIRKLVVMAVLIAIGVAGRQAFFMIPQFKPVLAIAIIAGATLGSNAGFIVGAMIAFVSNFFAGQGPWTPWQMLALGTVGFIGGLIFCHGRRAENKIAICAFGLLSGYIYGLIVDLWTIFGFYQDASWTSIATIYGAAVWYNTILAVATVIFLWILAKPLIDKIERIKFKYGIDV